MTSNKWLLSNVLPSSLDSITFGDGAKGRVLGSRSLNVPSLPKLRDVLLVDELKANMVSIIDRDLFIKFTKDKCIITDQDRKQIMEGNKSSDNCYLLESPNTCLTSIQNNTNLWRIQKGNARHNNLRDTIAKEATSGIPNLKGELERMCVPCQLGKQVRTPHLECKLGSTTRVLELVQMDLMGPMQIESIYGKSMYMYDFSRFTWVNFLIIKSESFEELWQRMYKEHNNRLLKISRIRSDHGKEFENSLFEDLCRKNGIGHAL